MRRDTSLLVAVAACALWVSPIQGQSYARDVLATSALLPPDSVGIVYNGIRQWLSQQTSGVNPEYLPPVREDLYRVIQSVVWYVTEERGAESLEGSDQAAALFDLATYLGVYGAGLVASDLAESGDLGLADPLLPEAPLRLTYSRPLYELESAGGWVITFPYYFMPWIVQRSPPDAGSVEFVTISTLHGFHTTGPRTSQATILVVTSRDRPADEFVAEWQGHLGMPPDTVCTADADWPIAATHRRCHRNSDGIQAEMGVLTSEWGTVIIAYSGLDGTYESNRPHFLTMLQTFAWR